MSCSLVALIKEVEDQDWLLYLTLPQDLPPHDQEEQEYLTV
jgi:hypothetical protein